MLVLSNKRNLTPLCDCNHRAKIILSNNVVPLNLVPVRQPHMLPAVRDPLVTINR